MLLDLPWPLVTRELGRWLWPAEAHTRVLAALTAAQETLLADSDTAWTAYLRLSDTFPGTLGELVATAAALT